MKSDFFEKERSTGREIGLSSELETDPLTGHHPIVILPEKHSLSDASHRYTTLTG